jgi:hypothetical protein
MNELGPLAETLGPQPVAMATPRPGIVVVPMYRFTFPAPLAQPLQHASAMPLSTLPIPAEYDPMSMPSFKAHVKNGRLVLDQPTDLPEGKEIELVPLDRTMAATAASGSCAPHPDDDADVRAGLEEGAAW